MAGTGPRTNHQSRLDWWRGQLQRHQKANLSVALFCRQLGVSVVTFYYWKRRVHEADSGADSSRVTAGQRSSNPIASAGGAVADFVPVSVVDPGAGTELEIELANACVVRLRGVIDPSLLQAAITAAGQLDGSRQGGP
jgi:transposase-like protein